MKQPVWTIALLCVACAGGLNAFEPTIHRVVHVDHCLVSLIDEVSVAAQTSGVVGSAPAHEGMNVDHGTLLMQLDDRKAQADFQTADIRRKQATDEAANESRIHVAAAALEVAETECRKAGNANQTFPGAIPEMEMQRLRLEVEKAKAAIELAELEQKLANWTCRLRAAERDAAETAVVHSKLVAPISGEIVELKKRVGEWVNPGEPVFRIVRMDRLRVDGHVALADCSPQELVGQAVHVWVRTERSPPEEFTGTIVFVDPRVQPGGKLLVRTEVENRKKSGQWLLLPGMTGEMSVDIRRRTDVAAGSGSGGALK